MTQDEIFAVILRNVVEVLPELADREVTPKDSMRELGANSIDRMDVVIAAQDELGIKVPASAFADAPDLGSLAAVFGEYM